MLMKVDTINVDAAAGAPHGGLVMTRNYRVCACAAVILALLVFACPPQGPPLVLVSTVPVDGTTNVSTTAAVTLTFDRAADTDSLDLEFIPEIAWQPVWSNGNRTVALTHAAPFAATTLHTLRLYDASAEDGGGLDTELTLHFTTGLGQTARDYRQDMRDFVQAISAYAKAAVPGFIVIPQNGEGILTGDGLPDGAPNANYLAAIDGQGREDVFYGYEADNEPTPAIERDRILGFLDLAEANGVEALVTDYCSTPSRMDDSYASNEARGYISFAANHRELDNIPAHPAVPHNVTALNTLNLAAASNFLYVLNSSPFGSRQNFLNALAATNFDLFIIDLFFDETPLTAQEVDSLRTKANGGQRLLICYMSIGEAEDYRYYWQPGWAPGNPAWLDIENPDWPGNYKVHYWDSAWQAVIFGDTDAYLDRIIDAGFDGVYLDIIDAYEYFEQQ